VTDQEKRVLADIEIEGPWSLIEAFSEMVREHPDDVNRAADVLVADLRGHGVPVTVHEPELFLSLPKRAEVRVEGASFRAKPPAGSADARDGVEAELAYVSANYASGSDDIFDTPEDAGGPDRVKGKIVLSEGYANPANVSRFQAWGAVGVIAINPGSDIHWGTCTTIWGNPGLSDLPRKPAIPAVAVNKQDGERLKEIAARGGKATVVAVMEEGWYRSKLPVVEIPGSGQAEKFVLLHGHYDSWDVGVGDNATGDATMAEVARVLWKNRDQLDRSIRIAWWPGHSTGRYAGSTWYADAFAIDLAENCVAQVNCDSPGCRWATAYKDVSLTVETEEFAAGVIADVTGLPMEGERAHQAGDYAFNNIGISSYFMLLSTMPDDLRAEKGYYAVGGCGGNIAWHTENDTMEIADKEILLKDIRIYTLAVLRNANSEILPFDWRATAREFRESAQGYAQAAGELADLTPVTEAVDELEERLESFYAAVAAGEVPRDEANETIQQLARELIPINFTTTGAFRHDPALTIPRLPDLALAAELPGLPREKLRFAQTELLRGRNRVVATLRNASRRVARATASAPTGVPA
jgi:N-acetylated-alpha-linked acidic dipeptidase